METKFTDGNWFVYVDANDHPGIESNAGQSIVIWGDKDSENDDAGVRGRTPEEALANANLLSASPDMFRALTALRDAVDRYFGPSQAGAAWPKYFDAEMHAAWSALNKANPTVKEAETA